MHLKHACMPISALALGAQRETRTPKALRPLASEASASTNFAIWARNVLYNSPTCRGSQDGQGACLKNKLCQFESDPRHPSIALRAIALSVVEMRLWFSGRTRPCQG